MSVLGTLRCSRILIYLAMQSPLSVSAMHVSHVSIIRVPSYQGAVELSQRGVKVKIHCDEWYNISRSF